VGRCGLLILLFAITGLVGFAADAQQPSTSAPLASTQSPAFRAGVDVVSLNATVTDSGHHYIADLDSSEFFVFEDGVAQDITFFNRGRHPIALSMLLDSSASMEHQLPTLQAAAAGFVARLTPDDLAQIVDFDGGVQIRQPFTSNKRELDAGIRQISPGGSTALYNAIYIALRELGKIRVITEEDVRRQALIVFSDGEDTSSLVSFDQVLDLAKRSETSIYTIALRGTDPRSNGLRGAEWVMRSLAQETGGRAFFPAKIDDLADAYAQIADELASQYTLAYTSQNPKRDGAWRRLTVRLARPGLIARARAGYYAPRPR
jgi:Ca-activated chloride channel family protein